MPEGDLDDLLTLGPPPSAAPQDAPRPIGVPPDYLVTRPPARPDIFPGLHGQGPVEEPGPTFIAPRYYEGDEYSPSALPPEDVARLQRQLVDAGLLDPDEFRPGVWDQKSRTAYRQALEYANGAGVAVDQAIRQFATVPKPEEGAPPLVRQVTNPADLRMAFEEVTRRTLGRVKAGEVDIDAMVAAYQQAQAAHQEQSHAASQAGGRVVAPPTMEAFAEGQVRQQAPEQARANDWFAYADEMLQAIQSPVTGAPGG